MNTDPPIPDELWQQIPPPAQTAIRALIQRYERRLADLEARLKQNSSNSSKPPSSDPPNLKRSPPKLLTRNKAGGQHGHAKAQRSLIDHPDAIQDCKPTACRHCQQQLSGDDAIASSSSAATTRSHCVIRFGTCRPFGPWSPSTAVTASLVLAVD
jgi:transposase